MSPELHVANLSPAVGSLELAGVFAEHCPVLDAWVSTYPDSERSIDAGCDGRHGVRGGGRRR
jgi:hypothetical protein